MRYRFKDIREDHDLSQEETAAILHMHRTQWWRYESGSVEIPFNIAILFAKTFHVSLDYLAGLSEFRDLESWERTGRTLKEIQRLLSDLDGEKKKGPSGLIL